MGKRKKRENNQDSIERRGFRNRHDSRIFVEPFDFFHVFSGLDFSKLSLDKILDRFEKNDRKNKDSLSRLIIVNKRKENYCSKTF